MIDGPLNLREEPGLAFAIVGIYPTGGTDTYKGTGR